jgi:hypothetical protein
LDGFQKLDETEFVKRVFKDSSALIKSLGVKPSDVEFPDVDLSERQFYQQKLGFHLAHALTWSRQLDLAIEFISNYDYTKRINTSRADHLIYNIENYLIRLNSVYDRTLQLTNAVFHLGVNDEHVTHDAIVSNIHVQHRPEVPRKLKKIRKFLSDFAQTRHSLIHKHSLLDAKLRTIELFYLRGMEEGEPEWIERLKSFRAQYLRDYVGEKKAEFKKINSELSVLLEQLFGEFVKEYDRQLGRLT